MFIKKKERDRGVMNKMYTYYDTIHPDLYIIVNYWKCVTLNIKTAQSL